MPNQLMNTASASRPKMIEGTAARLLIDTSIRSVQRFFGAYSSRYSAASTPVGKAMRKAMKIVSTEPFNAPQIPATAGSVASAFLKKGQWMPVPSLPSFSSNSATLNCALPAEVVSG